jgi:hypothetical protein
VEDLRNPLNIMLFNDAGKLFLCLITTNELPWLPSLADRSFVG